MNHEDFTHLIQREGKRLFRDMPWRTDTRPYYIFVSELMLQQTQVSRVIPKFLSFIERFPDEVTLALAPLSDVLEHWQGLGYNRRARFLHETAKHIMHEWNGVFPEAQADLERLPGIGPNTAGAIRAYAFNQPALFIETNIRTVYFHHFFFDQGPVPDTAIKELLEHTLDYESPRTFYWALMDYGSFLKSQGIRNTSQAAHYVKQSKLAGSVREVRGEIIRLLVAAGELTEPALRAQLDADERFLPALDGLIKDGLVEKTGQKLHLTK